jgi:hypothetical protein
MNLPPSCLGSRLRDHPVCGQVTTDRTPNSLFYFLPRALALVLLFIRVDICHADNPDELAEYLEGETTAY